VARVEITSYARAQEKKPFQLLFTMACDYYFLTNKFT